LSLKMLC